MIDKDTIDTSVFDPSLERKQMDYFFPKWINQMIKKKMINKLPKVDLNFMTQTLLLLNISSKELASFIPSALVDSLVQKIILGNDEVLDDLQKLFSSNSEQVTKEYLDKIKSFQISSLPRKTRKDVEELIKARKDDRVDVILENQCKKNEKIFQLKEGMQEFYETTKNFDVYAFNHNALSKNPQLIQRLKYAIDNPSFLIPVNVDIILCKKKSEISQWYLTRKMSIPEYKEFITKLDNQQQWQQMYSEAVKSIQQNIGIPVLAIVKRKELIESLFYNCKKQYYGTALITIFTVIEGLLWDIARQVDFKEKVFGKEKNEMVDCETNEEFFSSRIRDVIERTAVKTHLDSDFIKEFCEELYEERNPVLHGNSVCQYDCKKISMCFVKKLFVLDYLLNKTESIFEKQLFESWDSAFTSDKINEFLAKFCNQ